MAISEENSDGKIWSLCRIPFWQSANPSSSSQNHHHHIQNQNQNHQIDGSNLGPQSSSSSSVTTSSNNTVSSVARSLLPTWRRLRLDPASKLYFPYEPGKQVRSAVRIKNTSKSYVAFKFQTTAPKSCFMRPPGGILAPGESIIATVFKFVEHPENNEKQSDQRSKVKFKIMSLKVAEGMDYVPELFAAIQRDHSGRLSFYPDEPALKQCGEIPGINVLPINLGDSLLFSYCVKMSFEFDEQKDQVAVEQILRVVFLDTERSTPAMEKLNRMLAEAEAALEARKKPQEDTGPRIVGEGLVIDEWKERRERYLARQQVEGVESV